MILGSDCLSPVPVRTVDIVKTEFHGVVRPETKLVQSYPRRHGPRPGKPQTKHLHGLLPWPLGLYRIGRRDAHGATDANDSLGKMVGVNSFCVNATLGRDVGDAQVTVDWQESFDISMPVS